MASELHTTMKKAALTVLISLVVIGGSFMLTQASGESVEQKGDAEKPKAPVVASKPAQDADSAAKIEAEVEAIKDYCQDLDASFGFNPLRASTFVQETERGAWKKEANHSSDNSDKSYILEARVWSRDGKALLVSLGQPRQKKKLSGNLQMYFRPAGSIAKTVLIVPDVDKQGNRISIGKIQYFRADGRVLRTIHATKNHKTGKIREGGDYTRAQMPSFKRVEELPFYHLISKQTAKSRN